MRKTIKCLHIPMNVSNDDRLRLIDQKIFGWIYGLSNNEMDCCFASNAYLAKVNHVTPSCVSHAISKLRDCGYIYYTFDNTKPNSERRYLYVNYEMLLDLDDEKDMDDDRGLSL